MNLMALVTAAGRLVTAQPTDELPTLRIERDNTSISESCRIEIDPDLVIPDTDSNGVIHITADNITLEFTGTQLRGAPDGTPWDALTGVGVAIRNHRNVTIRGGEFSGFKVAIDAEHVGGFTIQGTRFHDNFRQRLKSTPEAEDSSDWLFPHHDDNREWATKWGGAVSIRHANAVTVSGVTVRRGQNGILLHDVNDSRLFDNDVSFLSGWGIAMFRSSRNIVSRNAADFCIRGHSEGVYNRGQDSAGILAFEQCSGNTFIENSATHGGDGFFGFGGLEALGDLPAPTGFTHELKGCNDNIFIGNDFSFASAHGLEMTFSFGNIIIDNQFTGDGICGIWGGYSQGTRISSNTFRACGTHSNGLERGGINIEHGANNHIVDNVFADNRCGVHLWWDPHADFETKPWGKANYVGTLGNVIANNRFTLTADGEGAKPAAVPKPVPMLHLRDPRAATQDTPPILFIGNTFDLRHENARTVDTDPGVMLLQTGNVPAFEKPAATAQGVTSPVGKRAHGGREAIIMSEWGPWDFQEPMVRRAEASNGGDRWEIFGSGVLWTATDLDNREVTQWAVSPSPDKPLQLMVTNSQGWRKYRYRISNGAGWETDVSGTILGGWWDVRAFNWSDNADPRTNLEGWRALAADEGVQRTKSGSLKLRFAHQGPSDLRWGHTEFAAKIGHERFGLVASASPHLPVGTYRLTTLSDDGVRVTVDGVTVIENWTWHGPTKDEGTFEVKEERPVPIAVEYFEIDGFAVLDLGIEPAE